MIKAVFYKFCNSDIMVSWSLGLDEFGSVDTYAKALGFARILNYGLNNKLRKISHRIKEGFYYPWPTSLQILCGPFGVRLFHQADNTPPRNKTCFLALLKKLLFYGCIPAPQLFSFLNDEVSCGL